MAIDLGCDEGGNKDYLVVSAQFGINGEAKKLKDKWKERLPAKLPYFHSKDFKNRTNGSFAKAGLSMGDRKRLLSDLASYIHRYLIASISISVHISEYNSLTTQDFRSRSGSAYAISVNACLLIAYEQASKRGLKTEFNILMESGHRNSNQVAQILESLRRVPAEVQANAGPEVIPDLRILSVGIGEKKDHPILQAADMAAYSRWQGQIKGSTTIWNALAKRRPPSMYRHLHVHLSPDVIKQFAASGARAFINNRRNRAKNND